MKSFGVGPETVLMAQSCSRHNFGPKEDSLDAGQWVAPGSARSDRAPTGESVAERGQNAARACPPATHPWRAHFAPKGSQAVPFGGILYARSTRSNRSVRSRRGRKCDIQRTERS